MTDDLRVVSEAAPAKINLYLHVLGRRDNGYHELDSLVMFAGRIVGEVAPERADERTLGLMMAGAEAA